MILTPKYTNSHFFDTSLKILTPAPLVVLVTNFKYASNLPTFPKVFRNMRNHKFHWIRKVSRNRRNDQIFWIRKVVPFRNIHTDIHFTIIYIYIYRHHHHQPSSTSSSTSSKLKAWTDLSRASTLRFHLKQCKDLVTGVTNSVSVERLQKCWRKCAAASIIIIFIAISITMPNLDISSQCRHQTDRMAWGTSLFTHINQVLHQLRKSLSSLRKA